MDTDRKEYLEMPVPLSGRLEAIVELAGQGDTVCDVGCDHAHVPIRLLQSGCFRRAVGMDVIEGPLGKAAGNLALYGMKGRIELRLSDGLDACRPGEADTLVVTGMGGTLMREILLREPGKTKSFSALVLGPQSDPDKVRSALRELGFVIDKERLIFEDGKYYPILHAVHSAEKAGATNALSAASERTDRNLTGDPAGEAVLMLEAEDLFGPLLLRDRDSVLLEFLTRQEAVLSKILLSVRDAAEELQAALQGKESSTETAQDTSCRRRNSGDAELEKESSTETEQDTSCCLCDDGDAELETESFPKKDQDAPGRVEQKKKLLARHLARQREIEHSLLVFRKALSIYR